MLQKQQERPPVHGIQKQLDPALKPEHDKYATSQNKQKGPTSTDAKPKAVLKPRLPASQIARKKIIDKSIKLLNKPKPQINLPKKGNIMPKQTPPANKVPQRQQTQNPAPQPRDTEPKDNVPPPVRYFEPNPLIEVPQEDKEPQEVVTHLPAHSQDNTVATQDPFDTQIEVPFSEDAVEPVFKRPELADFEIPPVLEEMIPDGALIHKHLPKQTDIDRILTQINRKYLWRMHLPCSIRDMQAASMQSP